MVFSKDVVATLPTGGIDIVNNETQEVTKIVSIMENEYLEKTNVIFEFEQIAVPGKDGKEEMQPKYIDTPGTYTYTIPAGVIKSVDGEEFPEQTFTFSIVGTFPLVSFSPAKTDKLEKISLTFDKEIIQVGNVNSLMVADLYYSTLVYVKDEVTISEDKKTVTLELETPITENGWWFLDIYQGMFISADGINENASLSIEVTDYAPTFDLNYKDGDRVKEIGDFEITFNNVSEVKLIESTYYLYLPGGGEAAGVATLANNKITVTFDEEFSEEGEYHFHIPAGSFTMDGIENEELMVTITLYKANITPLEILSVTPEVGTVDKIERIVIQFNQAVQLSFNKEWQQISREIILTCGEQKYTLTNNSEYSTSAGDKLEYLANAKYANNQYTSAPITADGTYTLDLSSLVVDYAAEAGIDEWGYPATIWHAKNYTCEGTYTWVIGTGVNAIEAINAESGKQVIYDILGRRIEKVTSAGIYIVNGKKVVIK